jgi:hypothetical protein
VRRLEEEKDLLESKLDDYGKLKSQNDRYKKKVDELNDAAKVSSRWWINHHSGTSVATFQNHFVVRFLCVCAFVS